MSKHTPEPWLLSADSTLLYALGEIPGQYEAGKPVQANRFTAAIHVDGRMAQRGELRATARLLKNAPRLLTTIKALLDLEVLRDRDDPVLADARSVVGRIEG